MRSRGDSTAFGRLGFEKGGGEREEEENYGSRLLGFGRFLDMGDRVGWVWASCLFKNGLELGLIGI